MRRHGRQTPGRPIGHPLLAHRPALHALFWRELRPGALDAAAGRSRSLRAGALIAIALALIEGRAGTIESERGCSSAEGSE
jgi:hypothetical protein